MLFSENNSKFKRLKQTAVPSVNLDLEVIEIVSSVKKIKNEDRNKTVSKIRIQLIYFCSVNPFVLDSLDWRKYQFRVFFLI